MHWKKIFLTTSLYYTETAQLPRKRGRRNNQTRNPKIFLMLILSNMTNLLHCGRCQNKNKRVSRYWTRRRRRGSRPRGGLLLHLFLIKQIVRAVYCSPAQSSILSCDFHSNIPIWERLQDNSRKCCLFDQVFIPNRAKKGET